MKQHIHTEYTEKDEHDVYFILVLVFLVFLLAFCIGLLVFGLVQNGDIDKNTRKIKKTGNTHEGDITNINNTLVEKCADIDNINTTINAEKKAILSKVSMTPTAVLVSNTENFPFDYIHYDPFGLYNVTSHEWTSDRNGWWHFLSCVTFDRVNTPGFDPAISHDHQLQLFINNAITTQGLFADIFSHHAFNDTEPELPQQAVCGDNVYQLDIGDTLALRVQTRLYPTNVLTSSVDGGLYVATRATLYFIGE
ncbi:MAG: hypothetical protein ACTSUE_17310 [Promethearchaeota archaeon]